MDSKNTRSKKIIQYNIAGIVMNLLLAAFKLAAGYISHAHAVMLDGVNSLSDSISSLISIVSTSLSGKGGDRNHPLGYGRIEYIGSMAVTLMVIYVGITMMIDSVKTILHPDTPPDYHIAVVFVMIVSLLCKTVYGIRMRKRGREIDSVTMIMTGTESLGDAMVSAAILAAIVIYETSGVDVEHYLCVVIAVMIVKTGIEMLHSCINSILGTRIDPEVRKAVIRSAADMPDVLGVSNIVLHNYGKDRYVGSIDIEVDEAMQAAEISRLSRRIIRAAEQAGVTLTSVGISAANTSDPEEVMMWDGIVELAAKYHGIKRIHSFTYDEQEGIISFYLVMDYSFKDRDADLEAFINELKTKYPDATLDIYMGIDM